MLESEKKRDYVVSAERIEQMAVPDIEKPYSIPLNWCWLNLLDSFDNKTDSKRKIKQKDYLTEGKYAIVDQGQTLIGGYTNDEYMLFTGKTPIIIFGDHTRCIKYIDFPFAQGADGVKVLSPKVFFDAKAFYYTLQSIEIPNLGYRRHYPLFKNLYIPLPPKKEQQRIVERIESLFAKLDEAKEKAQAVVDGFEDRKDAILHKAFSGDLVKQHNHLSHKWEKVFLRDVVSGFKYGTSEKSDYSFTGMPVLRIPNIGEDGIDFSDIKNLTTEHIDAESQIHENDILIIRSNGSRELVGKCALVPLLDQEYAYASFLIRIKPSEKIRADYLALYLNSREARNQMSIKAKSSAGIHNINSKELGSIIVKLPSLNEQKEIVMAIQKLMQPEKQANELALETIDQINSMKKSILARAFRGELGTNDPNDESAIELLRKILK